MHTRPLPGHTGDTFQYQSELTSTYNVLRYYNFLCIIVLCTYIAVDIAWEYKLSFGSMCASYQPPFSLNYRLSSLRLLLTSLSLVGLISQNPQWHQNTTFRFPAVSLSVEASCRSPNDLDRINRNTTTNHAGNPNHLDIL